MRLLCATLMLFALPAFAASTANVREKANETVDATSQWASETKDEFQQDMQKHLNDLQTQISDLQKQAANQTGHAKAKANKQLQNLEAKRLEMAKQMDDAGKTSGRAWDKFKNGMSRAMTDLQRGFTQAKKEIQGTDEKKSE